jgi:hypothetical protein
MKKSELKQIIKEEIVRALNENENKSFSPQMWTELGGDFTYDEDDDIYVYYDYAVLFYDNPETRTLSAEIQSGDFSPKEWKMLNKKLETLEKILDENNYEYSARESSWKIDFDISY